MIPENKKNAVTNALQTTFGASEIEDIRQLTAGLSTALVFRIVVRGKPYLLRMITRTDAMSDPAHEYTCMKAGAEAGIGPKVWYTDITEKIAITDFINAKPFPVDEAKVKMPLLLKKLHSLPPFAFRLNYLDAIDRFIQRFQADKLLPEDATREIFGVYPKLKNIYPYNTDDQVACHNDLKPENTLFDGERVWLVDWEAAFLNDRYVDLAIAANFMVRDTADEKLYLEQYFGREATEYQHARFFLMRQILHISYFAAFMLFGKIPGRPADINMAKPGFREFNDLVWTGEITLDNMDARQQYALVHREQLLDNIQLKRFEDSLQIVANYRLP